MKELRIMKKVFLKNHPVRCARKMKLLHILPVVLLVSCFDSDLCEFKEVQTQWSPNKLAKVVVMKKNCGATTSNAYHIFVTNKETLVDEQLPVFLSDRTEGLEVFWKSDDNLLITYEKARIFKFQNFWNLGSPGSQSIISIVEREKQ